VQAVRVKVDGLVVKGGGSAFGYTLDEPSQGRVAVRLALGAGIRWCAEAPAAAGQDGVDRFVGERDAPAPAFCPPTP
jgi:hypothetical protein